MPPQSAHSLYGLEHQRPRTNMRTHVIDIDAMVVDVASHFADYSFNNLGSQECVLRYNEALSDILEMHAPVKSRVVPTRTGYDCQLYIHLRANDDDAMLRAKLRMDDCVREMAQWMSDNKLKLNDNNSEVVVFNLSNTETPEHLKTFNICGTDMTTKTSVKNLGVYFERNICIEQQVKTICASCYFHLANIGAIRNSLTKGATEKL
ncbi:hypothetical protein CAPTEDRAFT_189287 [Capitella teleta]|uniref:Uncharacterized protein n=1 Tax=Capitella teleta TaxID=283909 RepID=R7UJC9_CAPTE|nr:hypothetical protein CAPTEDRAFT_189287 [Capitella teleta]|eukprot:ELU06654.1 hypothetical protein CAPTEDRAFT_189287 [Capitella teleta]